MTRQEAYVAELSQLLFYMTPWDKAAALKHVNKRFAEAENEAELMDELGTPMKLAVTLHRSYEATPEPTAEELAAREAAEAAEAAAQTAEFEEKLVELTEETESAEAEEEASAEEPAAQEEAPAEEPAAEEEVPAEELAAQEEVPAEEPAAQEEAPAEEPAAQEEAPAEEPAAQEEASAEEPAAQEEAPAEEPAAQEEVPAEEPAAQEEASAEEPAAEEEAPAEEPSAQEEAVRTPWVIEEKPEKEQIFEEIFTAATEAQSAVVLDEPKKQTKRKARYLLLIPYTIFAILVGVPGTLVFAAANLAVVAGAAVSLVAMVYLVIFHLFAAVDLGSKLILLGLSVMMLALTVILAVFAIWFLHNATLGFPRFLRETAMKHCYREVEVK